ncbi:MAG: tRNA epoxyqueuosine(34) reductase QueG [Candidatus Meridianibacter frigidus]|nr:MAG: tRNA epoxyqueuosine(34) reductase QueG [Candidatus Eremiobacteraeota bacterium]
MDDSLPSKLRARARELGALSVRISGAESDQHTRARLSRAFARGDFQTWHYDERYAAAATIPQMLLSKARSIVCVAMPYALGPPPAHLPLRGRVSNYAWGADYHKTMRPLLGDLSRLIDDYAGAPATAIACDTAPVAERAFAARAGLGWVGKHTNLIHPDLGSFVFLGEIVTSVALPADEPLKKHCGDCTRCVDACPTGALRGDYTIDAVRCISDLTQRTDSIPRELRALVGDWIWGCDICQTVCPPTMRAPFTAQRQLPPRAHGIDLHELLRLRSGTFKREYRTSAMGWRGAAVLRRNAAVALGNALDRASVPALCGSLQDDPHPMVREHAAWALGRIGSPTALTFLKKRLKEESDHTVCREIALGLEPFLPLQALRGVV